MVDISVQNPSWPNPTQYIQNTINANPSGTTYRLRSGIHRGQKFAPKTGDSIIFEAGAKLSGAEDISGGWISSGTYPGLYYKDGISRGTVSGQGDEHRAGFEPDQLNCILVDGELKAWRTSIAAVGQWDAYYDSGNSRVYIYGNPSGKMVEICRTQVAIYGQVNNVTVKADNNDEGTHPATFLAEIYGYASDVQQEGSGLRGGRGDFGDSTPSGTGWVWQDLHVHGFAGMGFAPADESVCRRVKIGDCGQLGHGGTSTDSAWLYCHSYASGTTGWVAGWEAGPNKFSYTVRHNAQGSLYEMSSNNPNIDARSVCWYDLENDGATIYDNIMIDTVGKTNRGLFWEISEGAKIHRNILVSLSEDPFEGGQGWGRAVLSSESGPDPSLGSIFDKLYMTENIAYGCFGGFGGVENGPRSGDPTGDYHIVRNLGVYDNITYFTETQGDTELTGVIDWNPEDTPHDCDYDRNLYFVSSGSVDHWINEQTGGSGGTLTWSQWQSDGQDPNGDIVTERTHPSGDPEPFNGGCMIGF